MPEGTIKRLLNDRGFGFIDAERGDLFFFRSAVVGGLFEALREGQRVEYEEGPGEKGRRAMSVKPLYVGNQLTQQEDEVVYRPREQHPV